MFGAPPTWLGADLDLKKLSVEDPQAGRNGVSGHHCKGCCIIELNPWWGGDMRQWGLALLPG